MVAPGGSGGGLWLLYRAERVRLFLAALAAGMALRFGAAFRLLEE